MQNISKARIINPYRYLHMIATDGEFYVAAPFSEEESARIRRYGLQADARARIPIPRGPATCRNANGRYVTHKDLPKESRYISHDYHIVDYHGNDHYGVCGYNRMCYQRVFIPPTDLAFTIEGNVLYSKLFVNNASSLPLITDAMNIILEMVGHFEIRTPDKATALPPIKQIEVPWEILRAGTSDRETWEQHVCDIIERKSKAKQVEIKHRHETLWNENPEFCAFGSQNFWGYVVYGFPKHNFYVFESNEINNATYIFRGDWKQASQLTKTEVLTKGLEDCRVFHTPQWYGNIERKIVSLCHEVA